MPHTPNEQERTLEARQIPTHQRESMSKKLFVIYDERAIDGSTDDAVVMVTASSLKEARSYAGEYGNRCALYAYDERGDELVNESFVEILTPSPTREHE